MDAVVYPNRFLSVKPYYLILFLDSCLLDRPDIFNSTMDHHFFRVAEKAAVLPNSAVQETVARTLTPEKFENKKVLLIIPDSTRTAPVGTVYKAIFDRIGKVSSSLDILIALSTHQPMKDEDICRRL